MTARQLTEFQTEIADALAEVAEDVGEVVDLYRDGERVAKMRNVIRGSSPWDTDSPRSGVTLKDRSVDFLVPRSAYATNARVELEPIRGDEIHDSHGNIYRVMPLGKSTPEWHWVDRGAQTVRRVHTKER